MSRHITASILVSTVLLLYASLSPATENKTNTITTAKSLSAANATPKSAAEKDSKSATKFKLVDLNHASKAELKSLPGINDTMADKIIAGRPYNSKAAIVTDGIVPAGIFLSIKARIVVK